ncbi:alpha/beta hydrolase [Bradyrhizobium sp. KBS0727]|jgi:esterase/lipase superfamily enzyme|uniref:alpha/beta hydrolase n=1 Tax=unclassified Bradyrhizobium TaxID=2631580 RepID=UPI00110E9184|nr:MULTISPECIES: alpha/beta hydrolase [unclassified Bradyrhizobium]QDW40727.1 alpha/beta hydrolase [Bradyrhizobium sp. KBS0725]QDW47333.1 alpha/beta hydrolase [Bradyrhizobium sp. KBS0727]
MPPVRLDQNIILRILIFELQRFLGSDASVNPSTNLRAGILDGQRWRQFAVLVNQGLRMEGLKIALTPKDVEASKSLQDLNKILVLKLQSQDELRVPIQASEPKPSYREDVEARKELDVIHAYKVWYGTNRAPNDQRDLSKGFTSEQVDAVQYGFCEVNIPKSHKLGSLGSSLIRRWFTGIDDRLTIVRNQEVLDEEFWKRIASQLETIDVSERDAVVFIHGYNVSFQDAALRAAQIGYDLGIKGAMAFFSWPSKGNVEGYPADEATIEASEPAITKFLADFAEKSGAARVHIIAHSMGNRGVLRAVNNIASSAQARTSVPFDQIILAAADVDARTFKNLCAAYSKIARRTTMYVSSRDRAVEAAEWLHSYPRAGLLPPVMLVAGIETVNVTNADLTTLGHGYVASAREVLQDIFYVLRDRSAKDRFLKETKDDQGQLYWMIGA